MAKFPTIFKRGGGPPATNSAIDQVKADIAAATTKAVGPGSLLTLADAAKATLASAPIDMASMASMYMTSGMPLVSFKGIPIRQGWQVGETRRVEFAGGDWRSATWSGSSWTVDSYDCVSQLLQRRMTLTDPTTDPGWNLPPSSIINSGATADKDDDVSNEAKTNWPLIDQILSAPEVRTAYLWGPPGIGKTYSAYHQGRLDRGLFAVTLTEETPAAELRGHWIPKGGNMEWLDGPVIKAMRQGARLVINEVTHASPDAWSFMLPILEGFGTARLTLPTSETVSPCEGFHVICTDNADPEHLPAALKDRFDVNIHVTTPHPSALELLPKGWRDAASQLASVEESRRVSIRSWLALIKLERSLGLEKAIEAVFGAQRGKQIAEALILKDGQRRSLKDAAEDLKGLRSLVGA